MKVVNQTPMPGRLKRMTKEQYKERWEQLNKDFQFNINRLKEEFAFANNPYNEGDIFTDNIGKIRIETIDVTIPFGESLPSCVFYGPELKADGTPKKSGEKRKAFQCNEKKQ